MHFYPLEAAQQVPGSGQRGPFCTYGGGDEVAQVTQLVAALHDERQRVVVVGGQLVAVQDHHLRASHLLLDGTDDAMKHLPLRLQERLHLPLP